jgi:hypothetical protein
VECDNLGQIALMTTALGGVMIVQAPLDLT